MYEFCSILREKCRRKEEFDYYLEHWDDEDDLIPVTESDNEFLTSFYKTLETVVVSSEHTNEIQTGTLPQALDGFYNRRQRGEQILSALLGAPTNVRVQRKHEVRFQQLLTLIAYKWIQSDCMTRILLRWSRNTDKERTESEVTSVLGNVFNVKEKFIGTLDFIGFFQQTVDVTLRVLAVLSDDSEAELQIYPEALGKFIGRVFVRYFASGMCLDTNLFQDFMIILTDLCNTSYKVQRIVSSILLYVPIVAQRDLVTIWLRSALSTTSPASITFYPWSRFEANPNYHKTLLYTIPFESPRITNIQFWNNYASYVMSNPSLSLKVWMRFTDLYWPFVLRFADGDKVIKPSFAYAALASRIKPLLAQLPKDYMDIVPTKGIMDGVTSLINTTSEEKLNVAWALIFITFDLCDAYGIQTGRPVTREAPRDFAGTAKNVIYKNLLRLYSCDVTKPESKGITEDSEEEELETVMGISDPVSNPESELTTEVDDGQEQYYEVLDPSVRRLRTSGLSPTSLSQVYLIFTGDITGSTESESVALKELAVLYIPMLLAAGLSAVPAHVEYIARVLLEWEKENEAMTELVAISVAELGTAYPTIVANIVAKIVFDQKKHSVGEKIQILKVTEKALLHCGVGRARCPNCCQGNLTATTILIKRLEPDYFPKYLNLLPAVKCRVCPAIVRNEQATSSRLLEQTSAEVSVFSRQPKTRRWGQPKKAEVAVPAKMTFHDAIWPRIRDGIVGSADTFLTEDALKDGIQTMFLIQMFDFFTSILTTHAGGNVYMDTLHLDVLNFLSLFGDHLNPDVGKTIRNTLQATLNKLCISADDATFNKVIVAKNPSTDLVNCTL